MLRQTAMADFVARHELACFKVRVARSRVAKTGVSRRGPWALCVGCA